MDFRSKGISVDGKLFENQLYFSNWILVVVVQLLSHVWLFPTPWTAACQASLSFTISHSFLRLMFIGLIMPSNHLVLCTPSSSCPQSFPASGSFPMSWLFISSGQSIRASTSASVLPWIFRVDFLYDWLVWSPCSPRDSQESSPAPQFKSIKFFGALTSLWSNSRIHAWLLEKS